MCMLEMIMFVTIMLIKTKQFDIIIKILNSE